MLLVEQPDTARARGVLERDEQMAVWWATPIECWSALARLRRSGALSTTAEEQASGALETLRAAWYEIAPSEEVRRQARRLLRVHPLRSADAQQLAAALVWAGRAGEGEFVGFDARLNEIARLEGFALV
jgi:uncharacterized protein